jgi:aldehyde dehydrogenase (NAD+)
VVAHLARGDGADVDVAATHASKAQPGWAATPPLERGHLLLGLEAKLRADVQELARLEAAETGKTMTAAEEEVLASADYFGFYGSAVRFVEGEVFQVGEDEHVFTRREPYGVVAVITPWNYPLNQAARSVAPALAAGNAVVLKPSEFSSTTAFTLAELATRTGLPAGVLNVVTGPGQEVGAPLVEHPLVRRVAFTGSVATGREIARMAAAKLIPTTLELGGKAPHIVFADGDINRAARTVVDSFVANAGQACSACTRLLVDRKVEREVVERVVALTAIVRPGSELGPLITQAQFDKLLDYFGIAEKDGATLAIGGSIAHDGELSAGLYVEPTVYTGVTGDMRIAREEIFGPVLAVIAFDTEDEAVAVANGTPYGLVAGIWTSNISRALRVAGRLEAGQVYVNGSAAPIEAPFGGYKASGYGREKSRRAFEEYTQVKSVCIAIEPNVEGTEDA